MKLIDFHGLNCYQNSVVTIAASIGVDYKRAFMNLWPETDFEYDAVHKVYNTKRMIDNLASLGIKLEAFSLDSAMDARASLSIIEPYEPFLIGMDTFYVPWSPSFQAVHDLHYFAARKESNGQLSCFDPTYNAQNTMTDQIASSFSSIHRVKRVAEKEPLADTCRQEINCCHPMMQSRLLEELGKCANERRGNALLLAKYMDAMVSNRYLYKYYLDNSLDSPKDLRLFFGKDFFSGWNAVKNGLYKSFVAKQNEGILKEVSELFRRLTDEEMRIAANG